MAQALKLDSRISFRSAIGDDDEYSEIHAFGDPGPEVWAGKVDVSDAERLRAGQVASTLTRRFVVASMALTRAITTKDRLIYDGVDYEIYSIKEIGTRWRLEITAGAERVDP
jgi:SPP1 family predicted phage head-tail adaptor